MNKKHLLSAGIGIATAATLSLATAPDRGPKDQVHKSIRATLNASEEQTREVLIRRDSPPKIVAPEEPDSDSNRSHLRPSAVSVQPKHAVILGRFLDTDIDVDLLDTDSDLIDSADSADTGILDDTGIFEEPEEAPSYSYQNYQLASDYCGPIVRNYPECLKYKNQCMSPFGPSYTFHYSFNSCYLASL